MSDTLKFSLRIPTKLHSDLKDLADKDMRSLNMYILKVLENHVSVNNSGLQRTPQSNKPYDTPDSPKELKVAEETHDKYYVDLD